MSQRLLNRSDAMEMELLSTKNSQINGVTEI